MRRLDRVDILLIFLAGCVSTFIICLHYGEPGAYLFICAVAFLTIVVFIHVIIWDFRDKKKKNNKR